MLSIHGRQQTDRSFDAAFVDLYGQMASSNCKQTNKPQTNKANKHTNTSRQEEGRAGQGQGMVRDSHSINTFRTHHSTGRREEEERAIELDKKKKKRVRKRWGGAIKPL
jgi:hypothetical protein